MTGLIASQPPVMAGADQRVKTRERSSGRNNSGRDWLIFALTAVAAVWVSAFWFSAESMADEDSAPYVGTYACGQYFDEVPRFGSSGLGLRPNPAGKR